MSARRETSDVGDAYIMALEETGCGVDIVFTCDLHQEISLEDAVHAFSVLVESHEALQRVKTPDPAMGGWTWVPDEHRGWRARLEQMARGLDGSAVPEPSKARAQLPLRIVALTGRGISFALDHGFGNARAGYAWIERFFATLAGAVSRLPDEPAGRGRGAALWPAAVHCVRQALRRARARKEVRDLRAPMLRQHRNDAPVVLGVVGEFFGMQGLGNRSGEPQAQASAPAWA